MENSTILHGIDVSEWQGTINWDKVSAAGVEFAMIRATHGLKRDVFFEQNIKGALDAGVAVGVYCCSYATDLDGILADAAYFLTTLKPWRSAITFPVVLDAEQNEQYALGKAKVTEMMLAFCKTVADSGYTPMVYTNSAWLNNVIDKPTLADEGIDVWVAWPKSTTNFDNIPVDGVTKHEHTMWQFSSVGKVDGIAGNVDLNVSYVNYGETIDTGEYITWDEVAEMLRNSGVRGVIL